jgi:tetratricopeptide (TPR) repeat protein
MIKTLLMTCLFGSTCANAWSVSQQVVELQSAQALEHTQHAEGALTIGVPTLGNRSVGLGNSKGPQAFTFHKTQAKLSLADEHQSRIELATRYLQEDKLEAAETLLMEGLFMDAYHPDCLRLMAFIEDRRQAPEKALELLNKVKPHQRQDVQYRSFLGYIYQKTGQYDLARQQYFRLLESDPENAAWVLGLSMALEAQGQRESALEGYHQLKNKMGIDPSIVNYAKERISILKG